jgi:hypothetical protein
MHNINYAIKLIRDELKKGSLSASNISSLTDDASIISTASTNVTSGTSGSKSSLESEASKPTKKWQATDNNSLHKWSKLNTSAVDKGSQK